MALLHNDFRFWVQKVLPLVYDESISYYEVLGKLLGYIIQLSNDLDLFRDEIDKLNIRMSDIEDEFQNLRDAVNSEIQHVYEILEKIKNGDYVDLYLDSIVAWINKNLKELVKEIVNYVSFGVSDDGYFVAYIPDTWDFITFNTIPWGEPLEGHLVLEW